MKVIAIDNFHPPGLSRMVRAGEEINAEPALARQWLRDGLVLKVSKTPETMPRKPETAVRAPQETAVKRPKETAVRKPRESR